MYQIYEVYASPVTEQVCTNASISQIKKQTIFLHDINSVGLQLNTLLPS